MTLPRLLLITDRHSMQPSFEAALEAALSGGARLIQLREKDLLARRLLAVSQTAQKCCEKYRAQLLINTRADITRLCGANGVHLPENELPPDFMRLNQTKVLCGVSVHSLEAAIRAQEEGADYLLFGSVFSTASHPRQKPAGLERLREICAAVAVPVFAVGGITVDNATQCLAAGVHGVAVIRSVWQQDDVAMAVRVLRDALEP
jgi:thiamine-phosphate pyrophosphorylase